MNGNNKGIYGLVGIGVFIISKVILGNLGIENIPVPIIIGMLGVSYVMILVGIFNKKLTGGERGWYIVFAILLGVVFITTIILVILPSAYKIFLIIILVINILSLLGMVIVLLIIKKKYRN
ncbi:MAG: hypothetical protein RR636_06680 [Clostridium sp.]|uniref:hypothetical protein n=1 Tax=Clostridium sp. TaxID=1506 RepID=UPI00302B92C6